MLGFSVAKLLPQYWVEQANLYSQKLIPMMDWFLSGGNPQSDKMSDAFYQISNKYINTPNLPIEGVKKFVREMGYGYILDFLDTDETQSKKLVSYLILIHYLKGTRKGLELTLNILGIQGQILEWWETTPVEEIFTFTLVIDANTLTGTEDPDLYRRFEEFVRNYVYPEVNFNVVYDANFGIDILADTQGSMRIEYQSQFLTFTSNLLLEDSVEYDVLAQDTNSFDFTGDVTEDFLEGDTFRAYITDDTLDYDEYTVDTINYINSLNLTRVTTLETLTGSYIFIRKVVPQRNYVIDTQQIINSQDDYIDIQGEYNTHFKEREGILLYYNTIDNDSYTVKSIEYVNSLSVTRIYLEEDLPNSRVYTHLEKLDNEYYILTEDGSTIDELLIF